MLLLLAVALVLGLEVLACLLQSAVAWVLSSRCANRGEIQELVVSLQDPKRCRSMVLGYEGILRAECLFKWSSSLEIRRRPKYLSNVCGSGGEKFKPGQDVPVSSGTKCTETGYLVGAE